MKKQIAFGALALYIGAIVLANYLIVHGAWGATATPFHTYTYPTLFGLGSVPLNCNLRAGHAGLHHDMDGADWGETVE